MIFTLDYVDKINYHYNKSVITLGRYVKLNVTFNLNELCLRNVRSIFKI